MQYDLDTRALSVQSRVLTTYGEQDILFTNATI